MESHPSALSTARYPPTTLTIAGHLVTIYGLNTLPSTPCSLVLVSLLHPRLQVQAYMAPIAAAILDAAQSPTICLAFDQRNHGTRQIEALRNEDWRKGNERHAVDLFAKYQGTALDLSNILDFVPAYLFPNGEHTIARHIVSGVSLGGHASWVSILHDPRIEAAGVIIGCADYVTLMEHRAGKSRLEGFKVGASKHFPKTLLDIVKKYDPAALGVEEVARRLEGKRVMLLSGAVDKLVPYECSRAFYDKLKQTGVDILDSMYEGTGHECTPPMVKNLAAWVTAVVERRSTKGSEKL